MVIITTYWYYFGIALAIAIVGLCYGIRLQKRQNLAKKIVALGDMAGMDYCEIVAIAGEPKVVIPKTVNDVKVKEALWSAGGYVVRITFDEENKALMLSEDLVNI